MNLLSISWSPSEGIDLGFFTIRFYSLMFVVAFTLGWFLMKKIFLFEKVSLEKLDSIFIYAVISTLIGARLGHFLFYEPEEFINDPLGILLPVKFNPFRVTGYQGLASHGAAIGIIVAMYVYSKKVVHKPLLWTLDRVVITVAAGAIFVRLGNFFNSEIVGRPVAESFPLGVVFKNLGESYPRHPAQLYEAFGYVFVFLILYYTYWKTDKRHLQGYLLGLFFVLLWSVRFLAEFVKESQGGFETVLGVFSTGQWLSIPFILLGFYLLFRTSKSKTV